ncbi:MAG: DUF6603 domain-containing protein [Kofleriaceae bacterium]
MATANLFDQLLNELRLLLSPITALGDGGAPAKVMATVTGWTLKPGTDPATDPHIAQLVAAFDAIDTLAAHLPQGLADIPPLLAQLQQLYAVVEQMPVDPASGEALGADIAEGLLLGYLKFWHPPTYDALVLLTAIAPPATLALDQLGPLVRDPVGVLRAAYIPAGGLVTAGDAAALADLLFPRLAAVVRDLGIDARYHAVAPAGSITSGAAPHVAGGIISIFLQPNFEEPDRYAVTIALSPRDLGDFGVVFMPTGTMAPYWDTLDLTAAADGFAIGPNGLKFFGGAGGLASKLFGIELDGLMFGGATGTRLELGKLQLSATIDLASADHEYGVALDLGSSTLVAAPGDGDSFLASFLPSDGLHATFALSAGYSNKKGLYLTGSGGLEVTIAVDATIGPVALHTVTLSITTDGANLGATAAASFGVHLGPVTASVDRAGIGVDLALSQGTLDPANLGITFRPPNGLGLAISAGPVSGGGYLGFDPTNGRYTGVMALSVYGVQVSAIGLLDTKLPNGETGYSFLVLISVEFTPIQLGFGFTLNGVGGLCGIHRDFVADAIRAGLRTHSLDAILFPPDPIANAPQIISELRSIFPPTPGRYVFGPMAKIGWGGGINLVTAELGVLFSLPSPLVIAVLGQLNVTLPNPDAAIVALHLDVLGVIDFGKKLFSLDGTLHDSRVASFPFMGDMAMRLDWGSDPSFALSIGGLNPHFQPPDGFPQLKPITISLSSTNALSLTIQSYLGVTSNTFQFGAQCELRAGAGSLNVYGWLGFDALFVFSPFSFDVDFSAGLALRSGTSTLMGISVRGELSGPTPWHVTGDASISLLFFSISVHVDITWGSSQQISAPVVDAWPRLKTAVATPQNWSGSLPAGIPTPVTLSTPAADPMTIYVDPNGVLTLRERVLPLNQTITKFGESVPGPQTTFTVSTVELGGVSLPFTLVTDKFAPAQFEDMSDQEKLSRPSFDDGIAGFSVGAGQLAFGQQLGQELMYVDLYDDELHAPPPHKVHYNPTLTEQLVWAKSSNAFRAVPALAPLAKFAPPAMTPPLVTFGPEQFVVATTADLAERTDITAPVSKGEAYRALAAHLAANPSDTDQLQVVPLHELAA